MLIVKSTQNSYDAQFVMTQAMGETKGISANLIRRTVEIVLFVLAVLTSIMALWFFYLQPWLKLTLPFKAWFEKNSCILPRFCKQPVWVDAPLGTALVVAAILLFSLGILVHGQTGVAKSKANPASFETPSIVLLRLLVAGGWLVTILWQAYQAIVKEEPPHGALWLCGMMLALALAITFEPTAALGGIGKERYALIAGLGMVVTVIGVAAIQAGHTTVVLSGALLCAGLLLFLEGAIGVDQAGTRLPWRYSVTLLLFTVLMLELGMLRAWSWKFAFVGDEWAFYEMGLASAHDLHPWQWFEIRSYNGYFAAISSQVIGWALQLFGDTVYGWRLASLLPLVISVPALYVIGDWLLGKHAGLLTAGLFAVQHSLLQFAMVPYNNTQAMPVIAISLALLILALQRNSGALYVLAGLVTGFSFIVYASARLVIVPIILLLVFHAWNSWRRFIISTLFMGIGVLASAAPMLFNLTNW